MGKSGKLINAERMQMRLCNRCNQWGETADPCNCTDDLITADQEIAELKEINGRLQYQNDRLAAKVSRLELAEKMAREARARMVAAEQRAEQAEKEVISAQTEFVEILYNRQAKIGVLKTAERNAVRECARIADGWDYSQPDAGIGDVIRNRYPQHFEGE